MVPDKIVLLQAQPISAELVAKLLGNRVAVSPIVTVEPRRRKFHKPITLTIPVPQAASKGMINQYSGDAPTLRLLCSITGKSSNAGGYSNVCFALFCLPNLLVSKSVFVQLSADHSYILSDRVLQFVDFLLSVRHGFEENI